GALLPDVRGTGRGRRSAHGGGTRKGRGVPSAAAGILGTPRLAMRFLHSGVPDARRRRAGSRARDQRRGAEARALFESVPLHRLPEHREGGARRRGRDEEAREVKYIGASPKRLEDRVLLLGRGQYAADLKAPGQLHMRVVRSSVAHAKILGIDAAEARRHAGVAAVWTYDEVRHLPPIG